MRGGGPFPQHGCGGNTPGKFWKFYVQNEAFGGKVALYFHSKQTANFPRLLVTHGSLKLRNGNLYSPYNFTVLHCTLNNPHTASAARVQIMPPFCQRYSLCVR